MIGLFGKTVPKTVANFKTLAEGTEVGDWHAPENILVSYLIMY